MLRNSSLQIVSDLAIDDFSDTKNAKEALKRVARGFAINSGVVFAVDILKGLFHEFSKHFFEKLKQIIESRVVKFTLGRSSLP